MRKTLPALAFIFFATTTFAATPARVQNSMLVTHPALPLTVASGDLDLPADGVWTSLAPDARSGLSQVFLGPSSRDVGAGCRLIEASRDHLIDQARWQMQTFYQAARQYAEDNGGPWPTSVADFDRFPEVKNMVERLVLPGRSAWDAAGTQAPPELPAAFIVPDNLPAPLPPRVPPLPPEPLPPSSPRGPGQPPPARELPPPQVVRRPVTPPRDDRPYILELRPYIDDGKHWVTFADGRTERVPVDRALLAKYGQTLKPQNPATPASPKETVPRRIYARRSVDGPPSAVIRLRNTATGETREFDWNFSGATRTQETTTVAAWAAARGGSWLLFSPQPESPIIRAWINLGAAPYGVSPRLDGQRPPMPPNQPRSSDAFDLLGGRAAMRETLQLEPLRADRAAGEDAPTIPIADLKSVDVKSHPFSDMLGGRPGGRLPLADFVPADRLLVHFSKPSALFPFLEQGADFLFRAGSLFSGSNVDDNLKERYLQRLGLSEKWGRRFIESGAVTELALFMPDLFLLDGTDVTLLMRIPASTTATKLMRLAGVVDLKGEGITQKNLPEGGSAFWIWKKDLIAVTSSRAEAERVFALAGSGGAGSLGASSEFRYMLEQLPPRSETRAFIYLSDPFIRRLTGPAVKIGQLRRLQARAALEEVTGGALLAALDGQTTPKPLAELKKLGYVPVGIDEQDYSLRPDFTAESRTWGTMARMRTLLDNPVERVTPTEQRLYGDYVQNYSQYWRQYFDPIALRLDDAPGGDLALSVFILPLADSQLYSGVRQFLKKKETGAGFKVPTVNPEPVLLLSVNMGEEGWVKASSMMSEIFGRYTGVNPALFDLFGPGLHVAIRDADPIIVLGNGDILGGFSGRDFTTSLLRGGIPLLLSVLTRPCEIWIELKDEARALALLRGASPGGDDHRQRGISAEFSQVEGRNEWIYSINLESMARLRFGIEVAGGYLIIRNLPWSQTGGPSGVTVRELAGAGLLINTGAVKLGLPALFSTQSEQDASAARRGMGDLYPLLATLGGTPEEAATRHAALFGWKPLHPEAGAFTWKDGELESTLFGAPGRWKTRLYKPGKDFGLFQGVDRLAVNMQMEDEGMRAVVRWSWHEGGKK